jgi:hypothetical protein
VHTRGSWAETAERERDRALHRGHRVRRHQAR